jgi:hypothetical protein
MNYAPKGQGHRKCSPPFQTWMFTRRRRNYWLNTHRTADNIRHRLAVVVHGRIAFTSHGEAITNSDPIQC